MQYDVHVSGLGAASQQFLDSIPLADPATVVPSCPDWTIADLVAHLAQVQSFWCAIVGNPAATPGDVEALQRPDDGALVAVFEAVSHELHDSLANRKPDQECWSWSPRGGTVAWVARRQHHEALIHLADLQLATAGETDPIDSLVAADGIDEMIDVMLDDFPDWMTYRADWMVDLDIVGPQERRRDRLMTVGMLSGTNPDSGKEYTDLPAARLAEYGTPDATVRGNASDLDLWLWGRGPLEVLEVDGDRAAVEDLRAAIADGTQ